MFEMAQTLTRSVRARWWESFAISVVVG